MFMQGHDSSLPGPPDLLLRALDNKLSMLPSLVLEGLALVWGHLAPFSGRRKGSMEDEGREISWVTAFLSVGTPPQTVRAHNFAANWTQIVLV